MRGKEDNGESMKGKRRNFNAERGSSDPGPKGLKELSKKWSGLSKKQTTGKGSAKVTVHLAK